MQTGKYEKKLFCLLEGLKSNTIMNRTNNKVVDFLSYKIEKSFRMNGFIVKRDKEKNIKLIIKIKK